MPLLCVFICGSDIYGRRCGLLGLFLAALILVGTFAIPGTAYRLQHPQDTGPLIGTLVQLVGLALALIAGFATIVAHFHRRNRNLTI